jgi:predicted HTH transcriptional regulator
MRTTLGKAALFADAVTATKESRGIDFKSTFNPSQTADWCELLKDVFAFANSGGGAIVVGVDGQGSATASDVTALLSLDPADMGNKIRSYTGIDFDDIEISHHQKDGNSIAVIQIGPADTPIVPTRPGTYSKDPPKQATAFSIGVVYVRHGAKSEPATTSDIAKIIDRRVKEVRRTWMSGIKKITTAPAGAVIEISEAERTRPQQEAVAVQ